MKLLIATCVITVLLSGCNVLGVYKIELPQGTPITQSTANRVQIGMTPEQVIHILGSPALRDTLNPYRWDYIYDYKTGTQGRRSGKTDVKNASQYLSIHFDKTGRVFKIEGFDSLPAK